jgi:hypothetical protein
MSGHPQENSVPPSEKAFDAFDPVIPAIFIALKNHPAPWSDVDDSLRLP